jgi:lipopolysaccharide heptosyltransferase II
MTWDRAANVLCVRLDAMGDVLMTTPAIRALRESRPGRRITLLTSPSGAAVAGLVPEVDEILVYESPWMKATAPRPDPRFDLDLIDRLRVREFDAAAVFTVYSQNPLPPAMLCYLAGIPLRLAHCRENPYELLTDWVPETEPGPRVRHEARRQLDLVAAVGASTGDERLSIRVPDDARGRIADLLGRLGIGPDRPWAVVHPGASAPSRRYPPDSFAEAARRLAIESGYRIVFTGDRSEAPLVESIQAALGGPSDSLAGELPLSDFAALVERAPVLISNNTGPVHMAAAVGTPVVDLYALTNLQHTPWEVPHRVLFHDVPCKLCYQSVCPMGHHDCLRLVPPGAVARAARELVAGGRTAAAPAMAFA